MLSAGGRDRRRGCPNVGGQKIQVYLTGQSSNQKRDQYVCRASVVPTRSLDFPGSRHGEPESRVSLGDLSSPMRGLRKKLLRTSRCAHTNASTEEPCQAAVTHRTSENCDETWRSIHHQRMPAGRRGKNHLNIPSQVADDGGPNFQRILAFRTRDIFLFFGWRTENSSKLTAASALQPAACSGNQQASAGRACGMSPPAARYGGQQANSCKPTFVRILPLDMPLWEIERKPGWWRRDVAGRRVPRFRASHAGRRGDGATKRL
jgi:hypothetical protein